jgi:hypothetical protein
MAQKKITRDRSTNVIERNNPPKLLLLRVLLRSSSLVERCFTNNLLCMSNLFDGCVSQRRPQLVFPLQETHCSAVSFLGVSLLARY